MRNHDRLSALHILGPLALSLSATAQRTWIVDPENRPGTDFTTLGGAILASADGDTIQVRPTSFLLDISATTSKALTIVGAGANHTFDGRLTIQGLPAGKQFVVRGLRAPLFTFGPDRFAVFAVDACQGSVHLQDLAGNPNSGVLGRVLLRVTASQSAHMSLRNCATTDFVPGLAVIDSQVLLIDCSVSGTTSAFIGGLISHTTSVAATIQDSTVVAVDTRFSGGFGYIEAIQCRGLVQNRPAISMTGSGLLVVIGAASAVVGGNAPNPPTCVGFLFPQPSITGQGTAIVDPAATLALPPTAGIALTRAAEPVTRCSAARSGGPLQIDVLAQPGALAATFVSLPGPVLPTPFGNLWLEVNGLILIDLAMLDPAGARSFTIPALSVHAHAPLAFQAAVLAGNVVRLTAPGATVVGQ